MCVVVLQVAFQVLAFFYFIDCLGFYPVFLFLTVVGEVFYIVTTYCVYY